MKTLLARWCFGREARAALARARADLGGGDVEAAAAARAAAALRRPRPWRLRAVARALRAALAAEGETKPCLPRALALLELARAHGVAPTLVLGVERGAAGVAAHAWLEVGGAPFLEDPGTPARYVVVARLGGPA